MIPPAPPVPSLPPLPPLPPATPGLLVAPGPSLVTSVPAPPTSLPAPDPVAIAVVASLVRTLLVTRARAGTPVDAGALRRAYGLTALAFGVVAALAVVLSHG